MNSTPRTADFGLIGLGVMGKNLALNFCDHGYRIAGYDVNPQQTGAFLAAAGPDSIGCATPEELVHALKRPRQMLFLVPAGAPVDAVIAAFKPLLEPGDILIDGGNSHFTDTERRSTALESAGIHFIGMGISGGETGARHGPSLMPGGPLPAWEELRPLLEAVSAKVNAQPCVAYMGPHGAGHYVKMVHNGIEYADMQLIAETYDLLHRGLELSTAELADIFGHWNQGPLESYLIEITRDILSHQDAGTGRPLVELILDEAQQKGTGKWTSQNALDIGVPIPTINAGVESRLLSARKSERMAAAETISGPAHPFSGDRDRLITAAQGALYMAKICAYAQGLALLNTASHEYAYNFNLQEIARIWRGGCIIRARLLEEIRAACERTPLLVNLMLDPEIKIVLEQAQTDLRQIVAAAVELGIPVLAHSASLAYFDSYRTARLPANLIQAQRDYFGAHTYRRTDRDGIFHTEW